MFTNKNKDFQDTYEDIINLPHHVSTKHPQMPRIKRAAQFAPFAALRGYSAIMEELKRETQPEIVLDEDEKQLLDYKLQEVMAHPREIAVTYFVPDEKKDGGSYQTIKGTIKRLDRIKRRIVFHDNQWVDADRVIKME